MICNVRVDHRLLHGQVVFTWIRSLGADCTLLACDDAATNEVRKTMLKLTNPVGNKLVIKTVEDSIKAINSGVTDKYKLFIVVESIEDAEKLTLGCDRIKGVTLGGTKPRPDADKTMNRVIFCTDEDLESLQNMVEYGIDLVSQQVPSDPKVIVDMDLISRTKEGN